MKIGQTVYTIRWLEIGRDRIPVKVSEEIVTGFYFGTFVQTDNKILNRREDVYTVKQGAELAYKKYAQKYKTDYWRAVSRALNNVLKED